MFHTKWFRFFLVKKNFMILFSFCGTYVLVLCIYLQNGIVHRDLKLENILLDGFGNVKVFISQHICYLCSSSHQKVCVFYVPCQSCHICGTLVVF